MRNFMNKSDHRKAMLPQTTINMRILKQQLRRCPAEEKGLSCGRYILYNVGFSSQEFISAGKVKFLLEKVECFPKTTEDIEAARTALSHTNPKCFDLVLNFYTAVGL